VWKKPVKSRQGASFMRFLPVSDDLLMSSRVDWDQEVPMKGQAQTSGVSYLIPARTISGSREEMVAEIDDVVRGLLGLRQLISMHDAGVGARAARRSPLGLRLWPRLYGTGSANR
jgi:hypothetical protein